jgi:rhamnosyltransferase
MREKRRRGSGSGSHRVGAVIVTYFPNVPALKQGIEVLESQVAHIVVVDNGSPPEVLASLTRLCLSRQITLVKFSENRGVAAAQNAGINHVGRIGLEFVILFDQDSRAEPNMVDKLLNTYDVHMAQGMRIGALGPVTIDERTGAIGRFVTMSHCFFTQHTCSVDMAVIHADFLISSGCLFPFIVLHEVGLMNTDYFIDHVDTEWCFRARAKDWIVLGVCGARIFHNLGDRTVRVWAGRWRNIAVHLPLRDYYMARNTLLMVCNVKMPVGSRFALLWRLLLSAVFGILCLPPRLERVRMFTVGILHGLLKRTGKYS